MEWIHFPRIRTFVEKRFHGLFSQKKRRNLGVFLRLNRFQEENTVLAVISLPYQDFTGWLKNFQGFLPENITCDVLGQYFLSRKFSPEKSLDFFVSKISPATGVKYCSGSSLASHLDTTIIIEWMNLFFECHPSSLFPSTTTTLKLPYTIWYHMVADFHYGVATVSRIHKTGFVKSWKNVKISQNRSPELSDGGA